MKNYRSKGTFFLFLWRIANLFFHEFTAKRGGTDTIKASTRNDGQTAEKFDELKNLQDILKSKVSEIESASENSSSHSEVLTDVISKISKGTAEFMANSITIYCSK